MFFKLFSDGTNAPGKPGSKPEWTTSQKTGVGTSRSRDSHVWFALHRGILGEIYYPRVDVASIKDMGMLVTDGESFFSEEKTCTDSEVKWMSDGVPGFRLRNKCKQGRYLIEKHIVTDPDRHVVLQKTTFAALKGAISNYHLYVLISPHLGDKGAGGNAKVGDYKGVPMLMAERNGVAMALACTAPWLGRSVGYVGESDGWQDLNQHKKMTWHYQTADDGNVALIGEIDLSQGAEFVLALGFGTTAHEAGHRARSTLNQGFDKTSALYEKQWKDWQQSLRPMHSGDKSDSTSYHLSTAVLATHESKDFQGGTIASLSFPWGEIQGDEDQGGYHLVWPRDMYETAGALLAAGAKDEVIRALDFFQSTQDGDGHWPQNMWLDGSGFWTGIQMDEAAAPVLLLDLARRNERVGPAELKRYWPMVENAMNYIVQHGPSSPQDRWEEDAGLTAYTLASMIAALLIGGDLADQQGEREIGNFLRDTADEWNDSIERWNYVEGTPLARKIGVSGYYLRIAPPETLAGTKSLTEENLKIPNLPDGEGTFKAEEIVSVDTLALVRFGLREAHDPKILNTLRVIDAVLKVETPNGPGWHRYNHDGYGEKPDGSPFDKTGVGRLWPLFCGERAHYELAAGNKKEAERLLDVMEALAGDSGLISEQVWDSDPLPEKQLFPGRPSGSARPLVWAHAEHVKLIRSLADGKVFDTPPQAAQRYLKNKIGSSLSSWRFEGRIERLPQGRTLRITTKADAKIRWSADDWKTEKCSPMQDSGLGLFYADLPTKSLLPGTEIAFTFHWTNADRWEGTNFTVTVHASPL